MKLFAGNIALVWLLGLSCTGPAEDNSSLPGETTETINKGTLYANEYGEIELIQLNDTTMETIFRNNSGDEYDTVMHILTEFTMTGTSDSKDFPFLSLGWRGIQMYHNQLQVFEFSNILFFEQFIHIEKMYDRPFYKVGSEVSVEGEFKKGEPFASVGGIYIEPGDENGWDKGYAIARGP